MCWWIFQEVSTIFVVWNVNYVELLLQFYGDYINAYSDQYDYLLQGWLQGEEPLHAHNPQKAFAKRAARKAAVTAAKTAKPAKK